MLTFVIQSYIHSMAQNYVNSTSHVASATTSPVTLLARCLVLASVLPTHYCSSHILGSGFCSASTETSAIYSACGQPAGCTVGGVNRLPEQAASCGQAHLDLVMTKL